MIRIPNEQKQIIMSGDSDIKGNIWSTFNMDFTDNPGRMKITRTLAVSNINSTIDGVPCAFDAIPNDGVYMVAGRYVYYKARSGNDVPNRGSWTAHAGSSFPTNCNSNYSDCKFFPLADYLYVTTASNTVKKVANTSGAWSSFTVGSSDSTNRHILLPFGDRMYMTRASTQVVSWDSSDTVATVGSQYAISLSSYMKKITKIVATSSAIWIYGLADSTTQTGRGVVAVWDGSSSQVTNIYYINNLGLLTGLVNDDVPYGVDVEGNLLAWNGGTFKQIAKLPLRDGIFAETLANSLSTENFIHYNGIQIIKDRITILIKSVQYNADGTTYPERIPGGLWEYEPEIGLYHKYSITRNLSSENKDDFGQEVLTYSGALYAHQSYGVDDTTSNEGLFLFGAGIYQNDGTSTQYISGTNNIQTTSGEAFEKYGKFTSIKIESSNITDIWKKLYLRFKKNPSYNIIAKYRTDDPEPQYVSVAWVSTTKFNTTTDLTNYVGYEVEITSGSGGGKCSHITACEGSGVGQWQVTVDETYANATGSGIARVQNWTKIGANITNTAIQYKELGLPSNLKTVWVQFKVCLNWTGDYEFYDLSVPNESNQEVV